MDFPNLSGAKLIGLDTETCDPNLFELGPGNFRGDGHLAGVSVAVPDGNKWYFPVGHETGENINPDHVARWLNDSLAHTPTLTGANLYYEFGWLDTIGVRFSDEIMRKSLDIQMVEPLLDEEQYSFALGAVAKKYLGVGKSEEGLFEKAKELKLCRTKKQLKAVLWRLDPEDVREYAEDDAWLPLQILSKQMKLIKEQGLGDILQLEREIVPVVMAMRQRGVRVDLRTAKKLSRQIKKKEDALWAKLVKRAGWEFEDKAADLAKIFHDMKIKPGKTPKGNPSYDAETLERAAKTKAFPRDLLEYRKLLKVRRDFIDGHILKHGAKGRIHAEPHPLRGEGFGTRSGRFSYTHPNLQQTPQRDEIWGPTVRSLYLPDEGEGWGRGDYSQQEPRLSVHFAALRNLPGAWDVVQKYRDDPTTNYHQMVVDMIKSDTDTDITYLQGKTINLGLDYGMGDRKLARELGLSQQDAKDVLKAYHRALPFKHMLLEEVEDRAKYRGFIKTLLGRQLHFNMWRPGDWNFWKSEEWKVHGREIAEREWPDEWLVRAFTHKAYNRLIQGSAADMTKKAMVDLFAEGYVPLIQVHDELDFSLPELSAVPRIKEIMESAVELEVPIIAEMETGPSWGQLEEWKESS